MRFLGTKMKKFSYQGHYKPLQAHFGDISYNVLNRRTKYQQHHFSGFGVAEYTGPKDCICFKKTAVSEITVLLTHIISLLYFLDMNIYCQYFDKQLIIEAVFVPLFRSNFIFGNRVNFGYYSHNIWTPEQLLFYVDCFAVALVSSCCIVQAT